MPNFDTVKQSIDEIEELVRTSSLDTYMKSLNISKKFDKLEDYFLDFKQGMVTAAEDCKRAIESPIYVGVVGHYSHGKSSLINCLLFPQKTKELLPTGDSIVTAMCTLIGFNSESQPHEFMEVSSSGYKRRLSENEYQSKVSGSRKGVLQDVHHFKINLNTNELASGVFKDMSLKQVQLLDTPGLGGPYWKDEHALQSWIKEFMLLIVAIKADSINKKVAENVNPFLKYTSRPIVPVVTFWDMWKSSPEYENISSEEIAREKAKSEIIRYFPTLKDQVEDNRLLFVSAKNYKEQFEIESNATDFYTDEWNIDSLRRSLGAYVSDKVSILESQRSSSSDLDINRKRQVIQSCEELEAKFNSFKDNLLYEISKARPTHKQDEVLEEAFEELHEYLIREVERVLDRLSDLANDHISSISSKSKVSPRLYEIQKEVQIEATKMLKEELPEKLNRRLERNVLRRVKQSLEDDTPLSESQINKIMKQVDNYCDDFIDDIAKGPNQNVFAVPQNVTDLTRNIFSATVDGFKTLLVTQTPLAIIILCCIVVVPVLLSFLNKIPFVGEKLAGIVYIAQFLFFIIGGITLFTMSYGQFKAALEKTALNSKEKARKANRRSEISSRILPEINDNLKTLQYKIKEIINDKVRPLVATGNDMSSEIENLLKDIAANMRNFKKVCSSIKREM